MGTEHPNLEHSSLTSFHWVYMPVCLLLTMVTTWRVILIRLTNGLLLDSEFTHLFLHTEWGGQMLNTPSPDSALLSFNGLQSL